MRSIPVLPIIALFSSLGPARADFAMLPPEFDGVRPARRD